jgi:hypothetical protein
MKVQVTKRAGLVAICLAAVTACSSTGSSPTPTTPPPTTAYSQVLQRIASNENAAQQRVADAFRTTRVKEVRAALREFQSRQTSLATELAALMPPPNAIGANSALAHALADSAAAIDSLITRIANAATVTGAFFVIQSDSAVQRAGIAIGKALQHLKELGYIPEPPAP